MYQYFFIILIMANKIIPYHKDLKLRARELRKKQTEAEKIIWNVIRRKSLGVEFHKQVPILDFIVDFYCHEIGLVLEIDGEIHNTQFLEDSNRAGRIESYGIKILRFKNEEFFKDVTSVLRRIKSEIQERG